MRAVHAVYASSVVGIAGGLWDVATGQLREGLVLLAASGLWMAVGRAQARGRQRPGAPDWGER